MQTYHTNLCSPEAGDMFLQWPDWPTSSTSNIPPKTPIYLTGIDYIHAMDEWYDLYGAGWSNMLIWCTASSSSSMHFYPPLKAITLRIYSASHGHVHNNPVEEMNPPLNSDLKRVLWGYQTLYPSSYHLLTTIDAITCIKIDFLQNIPRALYTARFVQCRLYYRNQHKKLD